MTNSKIKFKKVTENILETTIGPAIEKFIQDDDIVNLYNTIGGINPNLISVAMYYATISKVSDMIGEDNKKHENSNSLESLSNFLEENREIVEKIGDIAKFNNPVLAKITKGE